MQMSAATTSSTTSSTLLGVFSLNEQGTARILFSTQYDSFDGVLVNGNDETFQVRRRLYTIVVHDYVVESSACNAVARAAASLY